MASRHPKSHSSSSTKNDKSASKSKFENEDWASVTEREERRRIQNRLAQRKFREKARDKKERDQREAQNAENAENAYRTPDPQSVNGEDLSGLPWGGVNLQYAFAKGYENTSQQGSRLAADQRAGDYHNAGSSSNNRADAVAWDNANQAAAYAAATGDSSGGEDVYYDDSPYYYGGYDGNAGERS